MTAAGVRLRRHLDLFGNPCPNTGLGDVHLDELPDVVIPPAPNTLPERDPVERQPRPRKPKAPSRLDVGSTCQSCGKWIPGERRLCGRCFALGGRP